MSLHTGVSPSGLRHGTLTPRFAGSNPAIPASRPLGFSARDHTALCEAIYTIDKGRLENYYCTLTTEEMKLVDQAVLVSLGLTAPPICTVAASQEPEPEKVCVPINPPFGLEDALRAVQKERDTLLAQKEIYEKICAAALPRWPKEVELGA